MLAVACAICGGDPATDAMLVNAAIAGVISAPWLFRDKLAAMVRRVRGKSQDGGASCAIAQDENDRP